MARGQWTKKFTWLLSEVEVKGIVRHDGAPEGMDVIEAASTAVDDHGKDPDWFNIVPDANYSHLVDYVSGSNGQIHCETFTRDVTTKEETINRVVPYSLKGKPPTDDRGAEGIWPFTVFDPALNQSRNLRVGNHIQLVGQWVIENGHPVNQRNRGALQIGDVFVEFHPFRWDQIALVLPPQPQDTVTEILSLAAPLYTGVYVGQGKHFANYVARVASYPWDKPQLQKIFLDNGASFFHQTVIANTHIQAPALPAGFTPHASLISYDEEVLQIGSGLDVNQVRALTVIDDGVQVEATLTAPMPPPKLGPIIIIDAGLREQGADVNDPANGKSIFQARYSVRWLPRLVVGGSIDTGSQTVGSTTPFSCLVTHRGPDSIQVTSVAIEANPDSAFEIDSVATTVQPGANLTLQGRFKPTKEGRFSALLAIYSNDPAHGRMEVRLSGATNNAPIPASGVLRSCLKSPESPKLSSRKRVEF